MGFARSRSNRVHYPTAALYGVLCLAGVFCLKLIDVSEHLDVDNPATVTKSFCAALCVVRRTRSHRRRRARHERLLHTRATV